MVLSADNDNDFTETNPIKDPDGNSGLSHQVNNLWDNFSHTFCIKPTNTEELLGYFCTFIKFDR